MGDLMGVSLIEAGISGLSHYRVSCPLDLRLTEIQAFAPKLMSAGQSHYITFYFDMRPFNRNTALFGLSNTIFVMILLVTASLMFTNDANRLVLRPVEKMISRIEAIRDKPLLAMKMADDEFKAEEIAKARIQRQKEKPLHRLALAVSGLCDSGKKEVLETVILEKTIIKLGSLLALGFGEAGADIIGKNMSGSDSAGVNAMVPGRKCERGPQVCEGCGRCENASTPLPCFGGSKENHKESQTFVQGSPKQETPTCRWEGMKNKYCDTGMTSHGKTKHDRE
ncbi:unnamed protein product [Effrenium voratum]|uniref:Uncharacterized protein n=1 Tax=Effrenium voratum TaxID=2562239 RepID=A0AA36MSK0_9DINO|nr:unnamed protein product [Effrenium voratum]